MKKENINKWNKRKENEINLHYGSTITSYGVTIEANNVDYYVITNDCDEINETRELFSRNFINNLKSLNWIFLILIFLLHFGASKADYYTGKSCMINKGPLITMVNENKCLLNLYFHKSCYERCKNYFLIMDIVKNSIF